MVQAPLGVNETLFKMNNSQMMVRHYPDFYSIDPYYNNYMVQNPNPQLYQTRNVANWYGTGSTFGYGPPNNPYVNRIYMDTIDHTKTVTNYNNDLCNTNNPLNPIPVNESINEKDFNQNELKKSKSANDSLSLTNENKEQVENKDENGK